MKHKILIVDDEVDVCKVLVDFFESKSYSAAYSTNGYQALEMVKDYNPEIVLLDIKMPGIDGIELLKRIREFNKDVGIIMVTGVFDKSIGIKALDLGASDFVVKPIDLEYLETSVLAKIMSRMT